MSVCVRESAPLSCVLFFFITLSSNVLLYIGRLLASGICSHQESGRWCSSIFPCLASDLHAFWLPALPLSFFSFTWVMLASKWSGRRRINFIGLFAPFRPLLGFSVHDLWSECLRQTRRGVINGTVVQQHKGSSSGRAVLSPSLCLPEVSNISVPLNFVYSLKIDSRDLIARGCVFCSWGELIK